MRKLQVLAIIGLMMYNTAHAAERIVFLNNGSLTGANMLWMTEIEKKLFDYKVEYVQTNGNCALAKKVWDSAETPIITMIQSTNHGNGQADNPICHTPVTQANHLATVWVEYPLLCAVRPGLTLNEFFTDKKKPWTVSILGPNNVGFVTTQNSAIRPVMHTTQAPFVTAVTAGEIDFAYRVGIPMNMRNECRLLEPSASPEVSTIMGRNLGKFHESIRAEILNLMATSEALGKLYVNRGWTMPSKPEAMKLLP